MNNDKITIGSRGSDLALWQAYHIKSKLEGLGHEVEIKIIKTQGDIIQHLSFDKMEGKGFFTKEIEKELLEKTVDLAVHSFKDLETNYPEGLTIGAITDRANPRDVLLIRKENVDTSQKWELKVGALIGTSSARRKVQLKKYRPDISLDDIRGNVPTRVNKLRDGMFDAIVLAKAGLDRLEHDVSDLHVHVFDPTEFIPAPAQGALALQIREDDERMQKVMTKLNREDIATTTSIERRVLNLFHGGCQMPLGAYCLPSGNGEFELRAVMAESVNHSPVDVMLRGSDPEKLAQDAVAQLKSKALEGIS
ncbi:MAG: hydroxymethylbilane synthase [Cryomorphaceae bacterium]